MSNANTINLDLYEHFDAQAWLILIIDENKLREVPHVYLNEEILNQDLDVFRQKFPKIEPSVVCATLGGAIYFSLCNKLEYIVLRSFMNITINITHDEMQHLADAALFFVQIIDLLQNKISKNTFIERVANTKIYFVSATPNPENYIARRQDIIFGKTIIKIPSSEGDMQEIVPVFLTHDSARKFADSEGIIESCNLLKLAELWNYTKPIIIEPKRRFSIRISADELTRLKNKNE